MRLHLPQKSKMKYKLNKQWPKRSKRLNRFIRFKKQKAEKGPNVKRFLKIQKCKNAIEIKRASENLGVWKQTDLSEIMFTHCTGQLVSKGLFAILNSYKKKRTKKIDLSTIIPQVQLLLSFFGRIEDTKKIFRN